MPPMPATSRLVPTPAVVATGGRPAARAVVGAPVTPSVTRARWGRHIRRAPPAPRPMAEPPPSITELLHDVRAEREGAVDRLAEAVYDELRRVAAAHLRRERADHTLQPTALVHDAFL